MSDIFLSERNTVILTYKCDETEGNIKSSVMSRLLKIFTKVNL